MVNYKPRHNIVKIGNYTYPVQGTPKVLFAHTRTTTGTTLHDFETNADYQVPSGKTFTMLGILIQNYTASTTQYIYSSTAADGTTGEVDKMVYVNQASSTTIELSSPWLPTWAEDLYVTAKIAVITNAPFIRAIYGYET